MPSLEEVQRQISIHITALPPAEQVHALQAVGMAYKAGYDAALEDMKNASRSLLSTKVH